MDRPGINYLRMSITDRCNLRCAYCSPWQDRVRAGRDDLLTLEEFGTVAREAAHLGITKLRVTGGEPLARPGVGRLLSDLSDIGGIADLALTTNGTLLLARLPDLIASRFRRVNVHLDTLDEARYAEVCGAAELPAVIAGIDAAISAGMRMKLNAVCDAGMTVDGASSLARFGMQRGIDVRFIEAMPVAGAGDVCHPDVVGGVEEFLRDALGLVPDGQDGVARQYQVPGQASRIGFITPSHKQFCVGCGKLRVSSRGVLSTCLFAGSGTDLLPMLRSGDLVGVREALVGAIERKTSCNGREGCEISTMVGIGG